ncbi:MAG: glycosyltransferase, partial [Methylobacterium sp.]|nr:glycosyltransferase [Methylobacterium sp.]
ADAEIIIIDNESREEETLQYLQDFASHPRRKVLAAPGPFNFSKLCNAGARESSARVLIFLNNDTTALAPDWVARLCDYAIRPECGAVGARLLYPSGRVQHAGVAIGVGGYAGHVDLHIAGDVEGQFERARRDHSLCAVTGACLAVERTKFEAIGGFDEDNLPVDLNDIDLCLRLGENGWRTVYAAGAELVHHESASRGRKAATPRYRQEKAYFAARWRGARRADPYFHPALSLLLTRPSLG